MSPALENSHQPLQSIPWVLLVQHCFAEMVPTSLLRVQITLIVSPYNKHMIPVVVVMVLPESYACCKVTLLTLFVHVAMMLEPFRQSSVAPAEPKVSTARVDENSPAPVTFSVPPRAVAPD